MSARSDADNPAAKLVLGRQIGNYLIESLLGEGGMGRVYLAQHVAIDRKTAIKVLHPELVRDGQVVARFLNEARASNAIRHPNIVETFDVGRLEDGSPFIVMEYLEGETLGSRLLRGRLPVREALDYGCQAAAGLAAAHTAQIIHRDLKPENLVLVADPRRPGAQLVKILDFGIAKLQPQFGGETAKTRTGVLMGTPLYMSPEQCLGVKEVDARTDIYSLAVIIYEMLCGRPPFVSQGVGELINLHVNQPPAPLRTLLPTLPETVDAAILRALAKAPEMRFQSMGELLFQLASALQTLERTTGERTRADGITPPASFATPGLPMPVHTLSGKPAPTPPPGPATTARVVRRRMGPIAAAALVVVLVGITWITVRARAPLGATSEAIGAAAPGSPRTPEPARPPPALVPVTIASEPPGAEVRRGSLILGTTPAVLELPPESAPVPLTLVRAGYADEAVLVRVAPGARVAAQLRKLDEGARSGASARTKNAPGAEKGSMSSAALPGSPRRGTRANAHGVSSAAPLPAALDIKSER